MHLINRTPFVAATAMMADRFGKESLVVLLKGTWSIRKEGLSIAEMQAPIVRAPVYHLREMIGGRNGNHRGEPGKLSLLYDGDLVPEKPGTDCLLLGHAYAPGKNTQQVDVTFVVGPVGKRVRVFGERVWYRYFGMLFQTEPLPFEKIPLVYERAFGGEDRSLDDPARYSFCSENRVGTGFRVKGSRLPVDGMLMPNLEWPDRPIGRPGDRYHPAGFGPVSPDWQPRLGFAGTQDDRWRKETAPLPPADFNPRYFCSASSGLTTEKHLLGGEAVLVENASPEGRLSFSLPTLLPRATLKRGVRRIDLPLSLDTVIVEPDLGRVQIVWRGKEALAEDPSDIEWVRIV